jgi:hypothetical protein
MLLRDGQPARFPIVPYAKKIVLHTSLRDIGQPLIRLSRSSLRTALRSSASLGKTARKLKTLLMKFVSATAQMPTTLSSHPEQSLEEAISFARSLTGEFSGEIQIVELS